jgi:predicted nucleotidyltransferase
MDVTPDEQLWLDAYRKVLAERFPGVVIDLVIYGSKARGDARPDSDVDVLVVITAGDWRLKDALARAAYDLAIGTEVVPSIQIFTAAEWERLRERQSVFREAVERDGVSVR